MELICPKRFSLAGIRVIPIRDAVRGKDIEEAVIARHGVFLHNFLVCGDSTLAGLVDFGGRLRLRRGGLAVFCADVHRGNDGCRGIEPGSFVVAAGGLIRCDRLGRKDDWLLLGGGNGFGRNGLLLTVLWPNERSNRRRGDHPVVLAEVCSRLSRRGGRGGRAHQLLLNGGIQSRGGLFFPTHGDRPLVVPVAHGCNDRQSGAHPAVLAHVLGGDLEGRVHRLPLGGDVADRYLEPQEDVTRMAALIQKYPVPSSLVSGSEVRLRAESMTEVA